MINLLIKNRELIEKRHYVRKADPNVNYWFDFFSSKLSKYIDKFGDNFCLIIIGSENKEGDFYVIPFIMVKDIFIEEYLSNDKRGKVRWIGSIKGHLFSLRTCNLSKDISLFYGNPNFLNNPENFLNFEYSLTEEELNDYSIENRKIEINVRQKQSLFRKKVLDNFENKCCLTYISESNMLRASHIVPWSHKIDSRLNPSNGLCLSVTYDHLFDQGYISFTNSLQVIITSEYKSFSIPLQNILIQIQNTQAKYPIKYQIDSDYLDYHRKNILIRN